MFLVFTYFQNKHNNQPNNFIVNIMVFLWRNSPYFVRISSLSTHRLHTQIHHSLLGSSGWVMSATQRPLSDNTQPWQQTNFNVPGGIQTHNPRKRAATDPHCRRLGR